ncbi:hypothetical protein ACIP4W_39985 [Streptomyces sp. NPDC088846]|uniref:hypothetical protein n=1 Tax=Streptomyces sp. NPDC088846 TaxID=3365908 RepID=UPI003823BBC4
MGEHDQDQDGVAEPVRPPLTAAQAREVTAGLREAMNDVRRTVAVLAARVRDAHAARVWEPLAYGSWAAYCDAEFGISRAQAYRLLDVARALAAIHSAVAAGTDPSRTRDIADPAAARFDYGLSQRALIAVSGRTGDVAEPEITRRLATLAHSGLQALDEPTVRAVVRQAVRDVRITPPPPPADPPADPALTELRRVVDELAATHQLGELILEVAPAYLSDTAAADVLAPLCEQIGETLDNGLAARRYALSGDRRALSGVL